MTEQIKIDPNGPDFKALIACAAETHILVDYIQSKNSTLTPAQATAIAACIIGSLPALFEHNPELAESLKVAIAETKAIWKRKTTG